MSSTIAIPEPGRAEKETRVSIPWGSWYGDRQLELSFPGDFQVEVCEMFDAPALSQEILRACMRNPVNSPPLRELARNARSAAVVVDDVSRPASVSSILSLVIEELTGIPMGNIKIIVSLGARRPLIQQELEQKLGPDILSAFDVEQHHPYENLVELGKGAGENSLSINRSFQEAELKIAIGSVLPDSCFGFKGGSELVVPGLAGIDTIQAFHRHAAQDIQQAALQAGLRFTCNLVVNSRREIAGIFCGHPVDAHEEATRWCKKIYATRIDLPPFDVLVLNTYPKDTDLLGVKDVFSVYTHQPSKVLRETGTVVVTACCSTGRGYDSLHGKGMRLYTTPEPSEWLAGRQLILFSPNVSQKDFEICFWKKYLFVREWQTIFEYLRQRHRDYPRVGIFPYAPLQIVELKP